MRTGRLPRCVTPKKSLSSLLYARVYHSGTTFYNSFAKHRTPNNGQDIHYSHKSEPYWRGDTQRNIPAPKTRPSSSWSAINVIHTYGGRGTHLSCLARGQPSLLFPPFLASFAWAFIRSRSRWFPRAMGARLCCSFCGVGVEVVCTNTPRWGARALSRGPDSGGGVRVNPDCESPFFRILDLWAFGDLCIVHTYTCGHSGQGVSLIIPRSAV